MDKKLLILPVLSLCLRLWAAPAPSPVQQTPTRGWQCVPGVIRDDGAEAFLLEIRVQSSVQGVSLQGLSPRLIGPGVPPFALHDDGQNGDRVAGDLVFTGGPFTYNTGIPLPARYWGDEFSPAGLDAIELGTVQVREWNGNTTGFLLNPSVGVLRSNIPVATSRTLSANVAATGHLINIKGTSSATQTFLHGAGGSLTALTPGIFGVVPDAADFLVLFSTERVEVLPDISPANFDCGSESSVRVTFSGTGRVTFDDGARYGSRGRLQAVVALDIHTRGIYSGNIVHELLHLWGAYIDPTLGITDGTGHYNSRSSVGSLLGGQAWINNGNGTYTMNCAEGINGAHRASPLDKYFMGLIDGSQVPALRAYSSTGPSPLSLCGDLVPNVVTTTPIGEIQSLYGVRTPGPAKAQRSFRVMFAAESTNRFLTSTELTYYETLAAHFVKPVASGEPDPHMGFNWAPVTRFFGEGVTWSGGIPRFFDMDADLDVDQSDFGMVQACLTGSGVSPLPPVCDGADFDRDGDVDQNDVARYRQCHGAPDIPAGC